MDVSTSLQHLINTLRIQDYSAFRLEEKASGIRVTLLHSQIEKVFVLNEPVDLKGKARLKSFLAEFRRSSSFSV